MQLKSKINVKKLTKQSKVDSKLKNAIKKILIKQKVKRIFS